MEKKIRQAKCCAYCRLSMKSSTLPPYHHFFCEEFIMYVITLRIRTRLRIFLPLSWVLYKLLVTLENYYEWWLGALRIGPRFTETILCIRSGLTRKWQRRRRRRRGGNQKRSRTWKCVCKYKYVVTLQWVCNVYISTTNNKSLGARYVCINKTADPTLLAFLTALMYHNNNIIIISKALTT